MGFDPVTLAMANSYTDSQRLAYIETKRETAINPFTIPAGKQDVRGPGFSSVKDNIIDGAKYIVTIGGVPHKTNCFEDDGYYYIGNGAIMPDISAGENTGESFGCRLFDRGSTSARSEFYLTDTVSEDTTVTVELITETIHPIDPKFLPGVCLPVLELSQETMAGVFASGNASCTAEEHAIIWGAYQALSPLIINGNYNGIAFSGVSNILLDSAHTPYFEANAGALKVMVAFDDKTANIRSVQQ